MAQPTARETILRVGFDFGRWCRRRVVMKKRYSLILLGFRRKVRARVEWTGMNAVVKREIQVNAGSHMTGTPGPVAILHLRLIVNAEAARRGHHLQVGHRSQREHLLHKEC